MAKWSSTRVPIIPNREKIVSSTNGVGYPQTKEGNWTLILQHTQKSIQNKDLTIRPENVKLLEEKTQGESFMILVLT